MSMSSAFQLAIESFNLDRVSLEEKRKVWDLLGPRIERVADRYVAHSKRISPYYRDVLNYNFDSLREMLVTHTARLFQNEFDDQWVADTKGRVKAEIALGFDLRARGVVAHCILAELHEAVRGRFRLSVRGALRLID